MNHSRGGTDFNFFSHYNKSAEKTKEKWLALSVFAVFIALTGFSMFTVYYVFELRMTAIRYEIGSNQMLIKGADTIDKIGIHSILSDQLNNLNEYNTHVEELENIVQNNAFINTTLLRYITENIPKDTSINSLTVSGSTISISGTSASNISIAQFEHNLSGLYFIDSVFVGSITEEHNDGPHTFSMNVKMREAATDESNQ